MFIRSATWALALIAALALILAACSAGPIITTAPVASHPPTTAPTAVPTAAPIADGTYVGPTIQVVEMNALIAADPKLSAAQRTEMLSTGTTFALTLDLHGGQYKQGQIVDGGAIEIGSFGRFAFPDARTLILDENAGLSINTFEVTSTADGFTLKRTDTSTDAEDILRTRIFWETGPFKLMH